MNVPRRLAIFGIVVVAVIAVVASLFYIVRMLPRTAPTTQNRMSTPLTEQNPPPSPSPTSTSVSSATTPSLAGQLTMLSQDLAMLTPQSISDFNDLGIDATTPLSSTFQKLQNDVIAFLTATQPRNQPYYSGAVLSEVGRHYILVSLPETDDGYGDAVIDSISGAVNDFGLEERFRTGNRLIGFFDYQDVYTYASDDPSIIELPGAQLPQNETYLFDQGLGGSVPHFTYTANSLTAAIYDNASGKLIRSVTLPLP
jgi:hypothetical protein